MNGLLILSAALLLGACATVPVPHHIIVEKGFVHHAGRSWPCAVGRNGIVPAAVKREGDGCTPAGIYAIRHVLYRPDRVAPPLTALPVRRIRPHDGWCDAADHPQYNRLVPRPFPASHEQLWRTDHLYDLIVVLGYNDDPVVPGKGSAIFMHVATADYRGTAGCVALRLDHLLELLALLPATAAIDIRD
jgi:L,D-peptidoglycan transpeptidase YkuD (ErfK/YbiS/YcfS/YnhG family)